MDLGKVYCINLPERTDRFENAYRELSSIGITDINWHHGQKTSWGHTGCTQSHVDVLKKCRTLNRFTIFEDDIQFINNPLNLLGLVEKQLPRQWDLLYLGANVYEPLQKFSENIYHLKGAYCTHAIVYNNREVADYIIFHQNNIRQIDVFFREFVQKVFRCYIVSPIIATQADGHSDIVKKHTSNTRMFIDNFNQNAKND